MPRKQHTSGFVYIWFDKKHRRYYVGSHWGLQDDGYVCSSNHMRNAYSRRPQDFKRRILEVISTNKNDLHEAEHRWLQMMKPDELKGKRYYNICNTVKNHWMRRDSLTIKQKISETSKGRLIYTNGTDEIRVNPGDPVPEGWRRGHKPRKRRPLSQETKDKIAAKNRGQKRRPRTDEEKTRIAEKLRGRFISEETRKKISAHRSGHKASEEARKNMSLAHIGNKPTPEASAKRRESLKIAWARRKNAQC